SEVGVYTFLIVGFEWSRSQPHFIVEYIRHRLRLQVGLTAPVKFPVETSSSTDGRLQRPTQGPVLDEFFDWFDGHSHAVKVGRKPEPGIQPKHPVMPLHRIDDGQTFANGSRHGFFTPNIFSCPGCFYRHNPVPVGWRGDMNHIDVFILKKFPKIRISSYTTSCCSFCLIEVIGIHIADRNGSPFIVEVSTPHHSGTDDSFGELIRWSYKMRTSQYMTRNNGQGDCSDAGVFDKTSSILFFHLVCY